MINDKTAMMSMKKHAFISFITIVFFFIFHKTYSHNKSDFVYEVKKENSTYGEHFIKPQYLTIYEDSTCKESQLDILNKQFIPLSNISHNCYENDNWIKFKIKNKTDKPVTWTLIHADPHAFQYKIYEYNKEKNYLTLLNEAGTGVPFFRRIKPFHSFSEDISFEPNETKTFYAYYKKGAYYNFKYFLQTPRFAIDWELTEYTYIGVFYGLLVFAFIFSIISFFTLKQYIYLIYSVYLLAILFYIGHHNLLTFQFLWPNLPFINTIAQNTKGLVLVLSFYFYVKYYFKSQIQDSLHYENFIKISIVFYLFITLIDSFFYKNNLVFVGISIPYILMYLSVYKSYKLGFGSSKRFLIGFTALIIGFLIYFLMELNLISANIYTVYSVYFAFAIEIFLFTTALGLRYKYLEKEKDDVVFRFNEQINKINTEKNTIENEFTLKFETTYKELMSVYEKAKLDLMLAENEIRQLSETEGKSIVLGNDEDQIFMSKLLFVLENNLTNNELDRDFICNELGVSKSVLYRKLKNMQNTSINNLINSIRLRKALELLKSNKYTISDVAHETGFSSLSYFTKSFKKEYGCNPSDILNTN